jgi:hypothetical protein
VAGVYRDDGAKSSRDHDGGKWVRFRNFSLSCADWLRFARIPCR